MGARNAVPRRQDAQTMLGRVGRGRVGRPGGPARIVPVVQSRGSGPKIGQERTRRGR